MGIIKQNLAYKAIGHFNIIASSRPNNTFVSVNNCEGRYVAVGAAEKLVIWDFRLSRPAKEFIGGNEEITALCGSPDKIHIACGYANGIVDIFRIDSLDSICSLSLHKNAIHVLRYDGIGLNLASGGMDTEIIVSDVIAQKGKYRLSGHSSVVTDICYYKQNDNILISSSKDTLIKFWFLDTQICFKTIVDNRTHVWGLAILSDLNYLVTGCCDQNLNVYSLTNRKVTSTKSDESYDPFSPIDCDLLGQIRTARKGRAISLAQDPTHRILGCHGVDKTIELFYFCNESESLERLSKRIKKLADKKDEGKQNLETTTLSDKIRRLEAIKTPYKIKSISLLIGALSELRVAVTFSNNCINLYSLDLNIRRSEAKLLKSLENLGHQTEIRTMCFSSDSLAIASISSDSLKLWSRNTLSNIRTVNKIGYALCSCFVPGDRHVLVGLKSGQLLVIDVMVGEIIEEIAAHKKELQSISLIPNQKGCITGGGDATVKRWDFELVSQDSDLAINKLSLLHRTTLKLAETVLCVRISPNNKFIAVGLIDSTIQIFFLDSLKFYLTLYGHKLPVICLDMSYDSNLIVTGSADRNIKIWGLDFGDCHRSLFAHSDSVMAVQFVPQSHMFWSCGKDGKIKHWDADNFNVIQILPGHIGESYYLTMSETGHYFVTSGSDKVLRLYERTQEPAVLIDGEDNENMHLATGEETNVSGLANIKLPSRKTIDSEKSAELLLECFEVIQKFNADKVLPPLMIAYNAKNATDIVTSILLSIPASHLEEALVILPFSIITELIKIIPDNIKCHRHHAELFLKVVMFVFRVHNKAVINNHQLLNHIQLILSSVTEILTSMRDSIGINHCSLLFLQKVIESDSNIELFKDVARQKKYNAQRNKKRLLAKRQRIQLM